MSKATVGRRFGRTAPALAVALASACVGEPGSESDDLEARTAASPPNALTRAERDAGWRLLFDGETATGWRGYGRDAFPDTGWAVLDGALVVGADATEADVPVGGDVVTTESFADFDLEFDFMLSETANSGVLYRVIEEVGAEIWHNAPEYQVLDDDAYLAMGSMDMRARLTGANYDLHAAGDKTLHGPGEWNRGRVRVQGDFAEHWLNGERTVEYELGSADWERRVAASKFGAHPRYGRAARGPIGLQDHGREVRYRNLKVRPLEAESLFNGRDLAGWRVHGTELWRVENGELVSESGPDREYGYLVTERAFGDFDLTLEFKQEANGNSGVFFRASVEGVIARGWQAEVAPPGLHTGGVYESYGRGWLARPEADLDRALLPGEWNEMRVRAVGDRVETWLNGTRMVRLADERVGAAPKGSVALQIHDGGGIAVRWRNLRIVDLG